MKKINVIIVFCILLFSISCNQAIIKTSSKPNLQINPQSSLGILPLHASYPESGAAISDAIGTNLISSKMRIIERTYLTNILEEQGLSLSGATETVKYDKIGKITNVGYLLVGNATTMERTTVSGLKFNRSQNEYLCITSVTARIVDVSTGEIVVSCDYTVPKNKWAWPNLIGEDIAKALLDEIGQ
jgi:curli biogenesis system outer membrane secretion channel CsgG